MRSLTSGLCLLATFDSFTYGALKPLFDVDQIISAGPPPTPTIASGVASQVVQYNSALAASDAAAEVFYHPPLEATKNFVEDKHEIERRNACQPQPRGQGPSPSLDTPDAFLDNADFVAVAQNALAPRGYKTTFVNQKGCVDGYGYLGFTTLSRYDVDTCANNCNGINGCEAFNMYFERDPVLEPGPGCENPSSTTVIKCVYWGGPVRNNSIWNTGEWRADFRVVMSGSNGYENLTAPTVSGFYGPNHLGEKVIRAPLDCNSANTTLGSIFWNDGKPYDPSRCGAACRALTDFNRIAGTSIEDWGNTVNSNENVKPCLFFDTFLVRREGKVLGQYCAMYSESWTDVFATDGAVEHNGHKYEAVFGNTFSMSATLGTDCVEKFS